VSAPNLDLPLPLRLGQDRIERFTEVGGEKDGPAEERDRPGRRATPGGASPSSRPTSGLGEGPAEEVQVSGAPTRSRAPKSGTAGRQVRCSRIFGEDRDGGGRRATSGDRPSAIRLKPRGPLSWGGSSGGRAVPGGDRRPRAGDLSPPLGGARKGSQRNPRRRGAPRRLERRARPRPSRGCAQLQKLSFYLGGSWV
jgi:hypothetical protein